MKILKLTSGISESVIAVNSEKIDPKTSSTKRNKKEGDQNTKHDSTNKYIEITDADDQDYYDKIDELVNKYIVGNDNDKRIARDLIEQHKMPGASNKNRAIIKDIIDLLDEMYKKMIVCDSFKLVKLPSIGTRDAICIYGNAGSGKTYWTTQYLKTYKKLNKNKEIYLFTTNVDTDPSYKGFGINLMNIDEENYEELSSFDETTFSNSIVIFDDIETRDKKIQLAIYKFRDLLFQKSRKHNVDIINIIHKALDNNNSKIPNGECTAAVIFPRSNWAEAKRLLINYFNLNAKQIDDIYRARLNSRWVYVNKIYPIYALFENGCRILE